MPYTAPVLSYSNSSSWHQDRENTFHHSIKARLILSLWEFFRPILVGSLLFSITFGTFLTGIYFSLNPLLSLLIALTACIGSLFFVGWLLVRIRFWSWSPLRCSHCHHFMQKTFMRDPRKQGTIFYVCQRHHVYLSPRQ